MTRVHICSVLLLSGGLSAPAFSATVEGKVLDASRIPIKSATVALECNGKADTVATTPDGRYRIVSHLAGSCQLHATTSHDGETRVGPFALGATDTKTQDLLLSSPTAAIEFFDQPSFTVAGVTDNTYLGGHGSDTVNRSKEEVAKAVASLETKFDADGSHEALASRLVREPNNADLHGRMANTEEQMGHPLAALHEFQRAAELDPSEARLYDWGTELLLHGAPAAAGEIFDRGIRLFPLSTRMQLGAGSALYNAGNYPAAAQRFFAAADMRPSDPQPYLLLAKVQAPQIADSAGFAERMERFARLQPNNPWANFYYAKTLWRSQRSSQDGSSFAKVESMLRHAVQLEPGFAEAYLQLGIVYADTNDLPLAVQCYRTSIQLNPRSPEPHYRLAQTLRQLGSSQAATEETAIFRRLSNESDGQTNRERSELQKFVVSLKTPAAR